jgi:hypothetical protein
MIKNLLTILAIGSFTIAAAQSGKTVSAGQSITLNAQVNKVAAAPGCQTLTVINTNSNIILYTANTNSNCPTGGYVYGNNCYGYKEIATYFPASYYNGVANPSITAVSVGFYRNPNGNGTKGTTNTVTLNIYGGDNTAGPTASVVASATAALSSIVAAQTGTSSLAFYTFMFTGQTIPTAGFFASVVLPTNTGDTAVVYTQTSTAAAAPGNVNHGWGKDATGWYSSTADWNLNVNHVFIPIVCGDDITTGISNNLGLSKNVTIMPNPSNGLVNVAVNAKADKMTVSVANALGQTILSKQYAGIANEVISLDLTNEANGVYFVTVSNGTDKMVQRLIINK